MSGKYEELAGEIVSLVGGKTNVDHVLHCATRLRFNLKDESRADEDGLKNLKGVLGLVKAGGQLQVVIGPDVDKVFDEVSKIVGTEPESGERTDTVKKKLTVKSSERTKAAPAPAGKRTADAGAAVSLLRRGGDSRLLYRNLAHFHGFQSVFVACRCHARAERGGDADRKLREESLQQQSV